MRSTKSRQIFLAATIIVPFMIYCGYYYGMMVKNAPYRFKDFKSIVFKYGKGDSLVNHYNSKTGEYVYTTTSGKQVTKTVRLSNDELLYIHRKASDLGFWNFPSDERGDDTTIHNVPHYLIQLNYAKKSKTVNFDAMFNGDPSLKDANQRLIKEIQKVLDEAEINQQK
ncbi:hypothetical protein [Mucilaginibacter ginkgonis]|uniref:Uncharacterized protein n=1 Tax=Mucilaginibacter ginkgonis TaxID=2682091 RepID=A0A6I4IMS0_9SPHI|nr:hypothetical protein [Mucilaginibacter ginkgonis]QQL50927.1 hypothetical protein GO620_005585 [Mucilaginibacter ginkgonis]